LISRLGLSFAPVAGNPLDIVNDEDARTVMDSNANVLRRMAALKRFNSTMERYVEKNLSDSWTACCNSEAFVFSLNSFGGYHIAERLGVPSFGISIAPYTRTRTMPSI